MDAYEVIKELQYRNKGQNVEVEFTNADGTIFRSQVYGILCSGDSIVIHGCQNHDGYLHFVDKLGSLVKLDDEAADDA